MYTIGVTKTLPQVFDLRLAVRISIRAAIFVDTTREDLDNCTMIRPKDMSDWDWDNKCAAIRANKKREKKAKAEKASEKKRKREKEIARKMIEGTLDVVYVIGWSEDGPIKIGITDKQDQRLKQLQTGNPYKLKILHSVPCQSRSHALEIESWSHARLGAFKMTGEWFDINAVQGINAIRMVADAIQVRGQ